MKEIADHFGRSLVTISDGMKKVEDLERRDKSFAKTLSSSWRMWSKGKGENTELPAPDPKSDPKNTDLEAEMTFYGMPKASQRFLPGPLRFK